MKNTKGFTLIELIVVIAILGVLALILVPNFMGYLDDAKTTTAESNATNAYKIATASAAKGNMNTNGADTLANITKIVQDDYPSAVITCEGGTALLCPKIATVTVTSSGITSTIDAKGKVTSVPAKV